MDNGGVTPFLTQNDLAPPPYTTLFQSIARTYTATDECGNSSSSIQTITVDDETAPVITSIPADVTVSCESEVPAANSAALVSCGNCSGTPVITHNDVVTPGTCINRYSI